MTVDGTVILPAVSYGSVIVKEDIVIVLGEQGDKENINVILCDWLIHT
jgi:hypothetical protein